MPKSVWSTQQLAEFLAAVSSSETEASAALAAVERAAEALDAEVAAIVCGGEVVAAVGYAEGAAPAAELISVAAGGAGSALAVPGVGTCPATGVALEHPPGATLVVARSGPDGLSGPEASLLRGMATVTSAPVPIRQPRGGLNMMLPRRWVGRVVRSWPPRIIAGARR